MNEELSESSYSEWLKQNSNLIEDIVKKIYVEGFIAGFAQKNKINAMEQLQK